MENTFLCVSSSHLPTSYLEDNLLKVLMHTQVFHYFISFLVLNKNLLPNVIKKMLICKLLLL